MRPLASVWLRTLASPCTWSVAFDTSVSGSIVPVTLSWDRVALKLGAGLWGGQQAGLPGPKVALLCPGQGPCAPAGDYSSQGNTSLSAGHVSMPGTQEMLALVKESSSVAFS